MRLKREYPSWGAPKIRERLRRRCPEVQCPAISTVHAVLDRHGLVTRRRRRRYRAEGTALSHPCPPNDLWCADYKGEFMLADRRYCYPLTITRLRHALPDYLRRAVHDEGDPRTPMSRIPGRARAHADSVRDFRPWLIREAA